MAVAKRQVGAETYRFERYVSKKRWASFYRQIVEVMALEPRSVLEVGVGPGILRAVLTNLKVPYESMDIDPDLEPDHIGSVLSAPFEDNSYDVVVCFQVLEHLPYDSFVDAVVELGRVARKAIVISLPDASPAWPVAFWIPTRGLHRHLIMPPHLRPRVHRFDGQHYWEIGKRHFPLRRIERDIKRAGFKVSKAYRVWDNPYHRFFAIENKLDDITIQSQDSRKQ